MPHRDKYIHSKEVTAFVKEIEGVCKKHNLSISHEDYQGGFIIEPFDKKLMEWFKGAADETP